MVKIAYKTNTTNPRLPSGFITDHFETDQDSLDGHTITDHVTFQALLQANVALLRQHEEVLGIQGAPHGLPNPVLRPAHHAEPVNDEMMAARKQAIQQNTEDAALFQQFMAWRKSQNQGS